MVRLAAGCVILKNKSILLLHRIDKNWWEVPGGKSEEVEALKKTAIRELKEELNCEVKIIKKLGRTFFKAVKYELDYTWFLAELKDRQAPKISLPKEYNEFKYIPLAELRKYRLSSSAQNLLTEIEKGNIVW